MTANSAKRNAAVGPERPFKTDHCIPEMEREATQRFWNGYRKKTSAALGLLQGHCIIWVHALFSCNRT